MARYNMRAILTMVLLLIFSANQVAGSINWDGPVDAAISGLATFLQGLGIEGAGVRPLGYGFEIGEAEPRVASVATEGEEEVP
jgi:hypothetical protein